MLFFDQFVREGEGEKDRRRQELNNRMCSHNLDFGDNNTDFNVACTTKAAMSLGIRDTMIPLVVRRVQKSVFLLRSRFVSCVRTEVHMTAYLFVRICLYVDMDK